MVATDILFLMYTTQYIFLVSCHPSGFGKNTKQTEVQINAGLLV